MNSPFDELKSTKIWFNLRENRALTIVPELSERKHNPDLVCFDSKGEYSLYKRLVSNSFNFHAYSIQVHQKLELLPACNQDKAITWNVDFKLIFNPDLTNRLPLWIEYKGGYVQRSNFNRAELLLKYRLASRVLLNGEKLCVVTDGLGFSLLRGVRTVTVQNCLDLINYGDKL